MAGRLLYLMGASGVGKDSLLLAARDFLLARGCHIVRRVVTRSGEAAGEDAIAVSHAQFAEMEQQGAFALSWRAHGLAYGIPAEIDGWLAQGDDVVVNGSRGHWAKVRQRYPDACGILLQVAPDELRRRLLARGRESAAEIEKRLARNRLFEAGFDDVLRLDNSGPLEQTVQRLLALLADRGMTNDAPLANMPAGSQ
ncbi:phosphonate metabolism protein/1,5-bisphosphokinase (PRPP-forming) PhnN [Pseudomonas sp. UL073]|uniref:Ribose 1,5-bisphosphate phosphokinase PhnN n=1 Tax=Zestomonas insulae TaxID=2809017 RepID=A0ABS2ICQ4_9GAMM|nr:phosphonate metabolism protein/1,5-bisphosphokinase (PRPP-forming) PhnN [Pseudomonas insulae]MBM7059613.1 phosphonate metabolism protein/1,5-bisphosphokinase (PRPP-forming) PhnN [Pseudomonas insulae]